MLTTKGTQTFLPEKKRTGIMVPKAGVLAEPTLVGRERELEELMRTLDSVIEGRGTTVFITGEAGSGKTRLAHEFLSFARKKREVTVLTGWCLSNTAAPYLPFVEAFKSYYSQRETERHEDDELGINAWLTGERQAERTGKYGHLSPEAWKDLAFAAVTKSLSAISASKPVILFIEDLHWADSASLSLLHYVARALRSEPVFVLATFRSEELTSDVEGFAHPLAEEMRLMRRENLFREIKLASLDEACVTAIAENMMGGSLNPELAAKLSEESRGNALFVVESLRMLSDRGSLYLENDQWRLTVDTLGIPDKFRDVILRRLSLLKFNQRRVLDAASVIGERFDLELLGVVLGQDSLDVLEALNSIARATSLLRVEESTFSFDHAKSRSVIYEEIALPLKRGYHRRVAEKLETAFKDGRLPLSDISYHYAEAGSEAKAVKFALDAAQDALERFSNAEAIRHFAYVMEKTADTSEDAEKRRVALEGLGDAYYANCMYRKALEVFERLAGSETGEVRLRAYRKAMDAILFGMINFPARLLELEKKAEPYASSSPLESARIHFLCVPALPRGTNKIEAFEGALRVFEEEYSIPDVARTLIPLSRGLSMYSMRMHEYGKSVSGFLRSVAMYEELGDLRGLLDALFYAGESFVWYGVLNQEASDRLARAVKIGERIGHYDKTAQALNYLAGIAEGLGRLEEAVSQSLKAVEYDMLTGMEIEAYGEVFHAAVARQYAKLGDLKRAEEYYSKIPSNPLEPQQVANAFNRDKIMYWAMIMRTQGVLFAAQNSWKEADKCFGKGIEVAKGNVAGSEIGLRRDFIWALDRQGRTEEAKMQLEEITKIKRDAEEAFAHVVVEASLMAPRRVVASEEFEIRLDLVNVSKKQGSLLKAESLVPPEFTVTAPPVKGSLRNGSVEFNEESINAFQVVTIKLGLKALKKGSFNLSPQVTYIDDLGETKTCKLEPITIAAQPPKLAYEALPNRVSTGYAELDALLLGGIPDNYAVALTSPASDERELLLARFLEAGAEASETTFLLAVETGNTKALIEKYSSNFYLVLCNPQADFMIQTLPNVYKLKGVENLTEIDIALTKAFRTLNPSATGPRRFCLSIVSDVLLQHHAVATRRWLSSLLPLLKSKGFTTLAVVDPQMHPPEEVQAILSLFDGEIRVTEKDTPQGVKQALRVRRLGNQKFQDGELVLDRRKLEQ